MPMLSAGSGAARYSAPEAQVPSPVSRSFHSPFSSPVSPAQKRHGHSSIDPFVPVPQEEAEAVREQAARSLAVLCIPARQTGTAPGWDVTSCCLLSNLPVGFPRKKDKVSMCWGTLNKHGFKINLASSLFPCKAVWFSPQCLVYFCTLRGLPLQGRGKAQGLAQPLQHVGFSLWCWRCCNIHHQSRAPPGLSLT